MCFIHTTKNGVVGVCRENSWGQGRKNTILLKTLLDLDVKWGKQREKTLGTKIQ